MPIKPELRWFYPLDWPEISRRVRFERAGGMCEGCGRPHGETIRCLPDGRWFDRTRRTWRNGRGRQAPWPDIEEVVRIRETRVILAAAHLNHDPANNRLRNLRSLCQRSHLIHDRPHHLARQRITCLLRRALGDLFLGPYTSTSAMELKPLKSERPADRQGGLASVVPEGPFQGRRSPFHFGTWEHPRAAQQGFELGMLEGEMSRAPVRITP